VSASCLSKKHLPCQVAPYATGSTLIEWGNTRVICGVTVEEIVPRWMKEQNVAGGWITAEYSMLPYSTLQRKARDSTKGRIDGRSQEIQRLIGRALRSAIDLEKIGSRTIWIDCDVLQADGGTRTASITGAYVALHVALQHLVQQGALSSVPLLDAVAAVSLGIFQGVPYLDLNYEEDSTSEADLNIVMTGSGALVEIQGTAERHPFTQEGLFQTLALARHGIEQLLAAQRTALSLP